MEKRVYITKCDEYEKASEAVQRVFEAFGGAAAILGGADKGADKGAAKGKKVVVKPNLLMPRNPDAAVTTHPAVVEAVCRQFVEAGASVSIIDSTGAPHTKVTLKMLYGKTCMKEAASKGGAALSFDTRTVKAEMQDAKLLKKTQLLAPIMEADLVVSAAKAKTHSFQSMTGCTKNMFGCLPGLMKPNMHRKYTKREDFAAMLIDICEIIKPGFCILDGIWGMEGAGPSGGEPKHLGLIAGSPSVYAMDLAQCYLMGLRLDSVYTIAEAHKRGLAPINPDELTWLGDSHGSLRKSFKPASSRMEDAVPVIEDNCILCGDCKRICPMQCITTDGNKVVIDESKCIRCYCCHEFCRIRAISL